MFNIHSDNFMTYFCAVCALVATLVVAYEPAPKTAPVAVAHKVCNHR
jgi:hypothetical protein